MTIYACRIGVSEYSLYDFIEELELGYKKFDDITELTFYINTHLLNKDDAFLYPDDLSEDANLYFFIVDTKYDKNWIVLVKYKLKVESVELVDVKK